MTDPPAIITYASVVSRKSVQIALMIAMLNNLDILSADIKNAYLNATCDEKIWTVLGPEWRPELEDITLQLACNILVFKAVRLTLTYGYVRKIIILELSFMNT